MIYLQYVIVYMLVGIIIDAYTKYAIDKEIPYDNSIRGIVIFLWPLILVLSIISIIIKGIDHE